MKAAVVEKAGVLVVKDIPEPPMGDYDALCELLYGTTCTGTDSHIMAGVFPFSSPFPTVLGHESVGRVVKTGSKVRNFRPGDIVTRVGTVPPPGASFSVTWGGFAELGIAKDHWAMCADGRPEAEWRGCRWNQIVPAAVDPKAAPMFTTWRETLSYERRMGIGAGANVLVAGSGGNGLSFATHAVLLGAKVAMLGAARVEAVARRAGVTEYIDYRRDDVVGALQDACPAGFGYMIDAVGRQGLADCVLPCIAPGGKLGIYGMDDFPGVTIGATRAGRTFTVWNGGYDEAETHQQVSELALQGKLDAGLWYDMANPVPLADIAAAFESLRDRRAVKMLIELRG